MQTIERNKYIEEICRKKNLNSETQEYIKQYIELNEQLFGNFLYIDNLTNRVLNNLNYSINKRANPIQLLSMIIGGIGGNWYAYDKKILINPIDKLRSFFSKSAKRNIDSVVRHEIDHCATTNYEDITEKQKNRSVYSFLENNNIRNKIIANIIKKRIDRIYRRSGGKLVKIGIFNPRQEAKNGIGLRKLNEGITAWKQEMYDKACGYKSYTSYFFEKQTSSFIANMIGKEELIKLHAENDYEGIKSLFMEKTGSDLNKLVSVLNTIKPYSYTIANIPILRKLISKKIL